MNIGRYRLVVLCFSAALLLAILPAYASTVSYTDSGAWAGATTGTTTIDFTGIAPPGGAVNEGTSTGLAIDGVDFTGVFNNSPYQYQLSVLDQYNIAPWYNWGVPATLQSPIYNLPPNPTFIPYIHVVLPDNTTAISALLGNSDGLAYQVTLSDGEVFTVGTSARPNLTFFGVTADAPITYADFTLVSPGTYSGTYGFLSDFQFGTAGVQQPPPPPGDIPEAGTWILIGSGLVGLRAFRKYLPDLVG